MLSNNETKDLELICKSGHNSPGSSLEFVDLSLDAITGARNTSPEE
jgi:hypothetical protein